MCPFGRSSPAGSRPRASLDCQAQGLDLVDPSALEQFWLQESLLEGVLQGLTQPAWW